jgi:hypothetical protein
MAHNLMERPRPVTEIAFFLGGGNMKVTALIQRFHKRLAETLKHFSSSVPTPFLAKNRNRKKRNFVKYYK